MISNYTSKQVWEAMEILFPNDIDMFVSHCNKEFEWDYHKDIFDIIETLSDDAFINEVEMVFSQDNISAMESWLNTEYNEIINKFMKMKKNWCYKITDPNHPKCGVTLWSGRYCAVTGIVIRQIRNANREFDYYILANLRGPGTPDYQGYWNLLMVLLE